VTPRAFRERLLRRADHAGADVPDSAIPRLYSYFEVLSKWSKTINLTALPLDPPTDETFDRLLVEPLAAARHFPAGVMKWMDIGSGGGSPALPLRLACDAQWLTMIESKARKAAFLREAVRGVPFERTSVLNARLEAVEPDAGQPFADLATIRAVKLSSELQSAVAGLLSPEGWLLLFQPTSNAAAVAGFRVVSVTPLIPNSAFLATYRRTFHVEQR
jgi:16S rRNA (guanine527-N7)-methyltransferase